LLEETMGAFDWNWTRAWHVYSQQTWIQLKQHTWLS